MKSKAAKSGHPRRHLYPKETGKSLYPSMKPPVNDARWAANLCPDFHDLEDRRRMLLTQRSQTLGTIPPRKKTCYHRSKSSSAMMASSSWATDQRSEGMHPSGWTPAPPPPRPMDTASWHRRVDGGTQLEVPNAPVESRTRLVEDGAWDSEEIRIIPYKDYMAGRWRRTPCLKDDFQRHNSSSNTVFEKSPSRMKECRQTVRVERLQIVNLLDSNRQVYGDPGTSRKSQYKPSTCIEEGERILPNDSAGLISDQEGWRWEMPSRFSPHHYESNDLGQHLISPISAESLLIRRGCRIYPKTGTATYDDGNSNDDNVDDSCRTLSSMSYSVGASGQTSHVDMEIAKTFANRSFPEFSEEQQEVSSINLESSRPSRHFRKIAGAREEDNHEKVNLTPPLDYSYTLSSTRPSTSAISFSHCSFPPVDVREAEGQQASAVPQLSEDVIKIYKQTAIEILLERKRENEKRIFQESQKVERNYSAAWCRFDGNGGKCGNSKVKKNSFVKASADRKSSSLCMGSKRVDNCLTTKKSAKGTAVKDQGSGIKHLNNNEVFENHQCPERAKKRQSISAWRRSISSIISRYQAAREMRQKALKDDPLRKHNQTSATSDKAPTRWKSDSRPGRSISIPASIMASKRNEPETRFPRRGSYMEECHSPSMDTASGVTIKDNDNSFGQVEFMHDILKSPSAKAIQALGWFYQGMANSDQDTNMKLLEDVDITVAEILKKYYLLYAGTVETPTASLLTTVDDGVDHNATDNTSHNLSVIKSSQDALVGQGEGSKADAHDTKVERHDILTPNPTRIDLESDDRTSVTSGTFLSYLMPDNVAVADEKALPSYMDQMSRNMTLLKSQLYQGRGEMPVTKRYTPKSDWENSIPDPWCALPPTELETPTPTYVSGKREHSRPVERSVQNAVPHLIQAAAEQSLCQEKATRRKEVCFHRDHQGRDYVQRLYGSQQHRPAEEKRNDIPESHYSSGNAPNKNIPSDDDARAYEQGKDQTQQASCRSPHDINATFEVHRQINGQDYVPRFNTCHAELPCLDEHSAIACGEQHTDSFWMMKSSDGQKPSAPMDFSDGKHEIELAKMNPPQPIRRSTNIKGVKEGLTKMMSNKEPRLGKLQMGKQNCKKSDMWTRLQCNKQETSGDSNLQRTDKCNQVFESHLDKINDHRNTFTAGKRFQFDSRAMSDDQWTTVNISEDKMAQGPHNRLSPNNCVKIEEITQKIFESLRDKVFGKQTETSRTLPIDPRKGAASRPTANSCDRDRRTIKSCSRHQCQDAPPRTVVKTSAKDSPSMGHAKTDENEMMTMSLKRRKGKCLPRHDMFTSGLNSKARVTFKSALNAYLSMKKESSRTRGSAESELSRTRIFPWRQSKSGELATIAKSHSLSEIYNRSLCKENSAVNHQGRCCKSLNKSVGRFPHDSSSQPNTANAPNDILKSTSWTRNISPKSSTNQTISEKIKSKEEDSTSKKDSEDVSEDTFSCVITHTVRKTCIKLLEERRHAMQKLLEPDPATTRTDGDRFPRKALSCTLCSSGSVSLNTEPELSHGSSESNVSGFHNRAIIETSGRVQTPEDTWPRWRGGQSDVEGAFGIKQKPEITFKPKPPSTESLVVNPNLALRGNDTARNATSSTKLDFIDIYPTLYKEARVVMRHRRSEKQARERDGTNEGTHELFSIDSVRVDNFINEPSAFCNIGLSAKQDGWKTNLKPSCASQVSNIGAVKHRTEGTATCKAQTDLAASQSCKTSCINLYLSYWSDNSESEIRSRYNRFVNIVNRLMARAGFTTQAFQLMRFNLLNEALVYGESAIGKNCLLAIGKCLELGQLPKIGMMKSERVNVIEEKDHDGKEDESNRSLGNTEEMGANVRLANGTSADAKSRFQSSGQSVLDNGNDHHGIMVIVNERASPDGNGDAKLPFAIKEPAKSILEKLARGIPPNIDNTLCIDCPRIADYFLSLLASTLPCPLGKPNMVSVWLKGSNASIRNGGLLTACPNFRPGSTVPSVMTLEEDIEDTICQFRPTKADACVWSTLIEHNRDTLHELCLLHPRTSRGDKECLEYCDQDKCNTEKKNVHDNEMGQSKHIQGNKTSENEDGGVMSSCIVNNFNDGDQGMESDKCLDDCYDERHSQALEEKIIPGVKDYSFKKDTVGRSDESMNPIIVKAEGKPRAKKNALVCSQHTDIADASRSNNLFKDESVDDKQDKLAQDKIGLNNIAPPSGEAQQKTTRLVATGHLCQDKFLMHSGQSPEAMVDSLLSTDKVGKRFDNVELSGTVQDSGAETQANGGFARPNGPCVSVADVNHQHSMLTPFQETATQQSIGKAPDAIDSNAEFKAATIEDFLSEKEYETSIAAALTCLEGDGLKSNFDSSSSSMDLSETRMENVPPSHCLKSPSPPLSNVVSDRIDSHLPGDERVVQFTSQPTNHFEPQGKVGIAAMLLSLYTHPNNQPTIGFASRDASSRVQTPHESQKSDEVWTRGISVANKAAIRPIPRGQTMPRSSRRSGRGNHHPHDMSASGVARSDESSHQYSDVHASTSSSCCCPSSETSSSGRGAQDPNCVDDTRVMDSAASEQCVHQAYPIYNTAERRDFPSNRKGIPEGDCSYRYEDCRVTTNDEWSSNFTKSLSSDDLHDTYESVRREHGQCETQTFLSNSNPTFGSRISNKKLCRSCPASPHSSQKRILVRDASLPDSMMGKSKLGAKHRKSKPREKMPASMVTEYLDMNSCDSDGKEVPSINMEFHDEISERLAETFCPKYTKTISSRSSAKNGVFLYFPPPCGTSVPMNRQATGRKGDTTIFKKKPKVSKHFELQPSKYCARSKMASRQKISFKPLTNMREAITRQGLRENSLPGHNLDDDSDAKLTDAPGRTYCRSSRRRRTGGHGIYSNYSVYHSAHPLSQFDACDPILNRRVSFFSSCTDWNDPCPGMSRNNSPPILNNAEAAQCECEQDCFHPTRRLNETKVNLPRPMITKMDFTGSTACLSDSSEEESELDSATNIITRDKETHRGQTSHEKTKHGCRYIHYPHTTGRRQMSSRKTDRSGYKVRGRMFCSSCSSHRDMNALSRLERAKSGSLQRSAKSCSDTTLDAGSFATDVVPSRRSVLQSSDLCQNLTNDCRHRVQNQTTKHKDDLSSLSATVVSENKGIETILASCLVEALESVLKKRRSRKTTLDRPQSLQRHMSNTSPMEIHLGKKGRAVFGSRLKTRMSRMQGSHTSGFGCETNTLAQISPLPVDGHSAFNIANEGDNHRKRKEYTIDPFEYMDITSNADIDRLQSLRTDDGEISISQDKLATSDDKPRLRLDDWEPVNHCISCAQISRSSGSRNGGDGGFRERNVRPRSWPRQSFITHEVASRSNSHDSCSAVGSQPRGVSDECVKHFGHELELNFAVKKTKSVKLGTQFTNSKHSDSELIPSYKFSNASGLTNLMKEAVTLTSSTSCPNMSTVREGRVLSRSCQPALKCAKSVFNDGNKNCLTDNASPVVYKTTHSKRSREMENFTLRNHTTHRGNKQRGVLQTLSSSSSKMFAYRERIKIDCKRSDNLQSNSSSTGTCNTKLAKTEFQRRQAEHNDRGSLALFENSMSRSLDRIPQKSPERSDIKVKHLNQEQVQNRCPETSDGSNSISRRLQNRERLATRKEAVAGRDTSEKSTKEILCEEKDLKKRLSDSLGRPKLGRRRTRIPTRHMQPESPHAKATRNGMRLLHEGDTEPVSHTKGTQVIMSRCEESVISLIYEETNSGEIQTPMVEMVERKTSSLGEGPTCQCIDCEPVGRDQRGGHRFVVKNGGKHPQDRPINCASSVLIKEQDQEKSMVSECDELLLSQTEKQELTVRVDVNEISKIQQSNGYQMLSSQESNKQESNKYPMSQQSDKQESNNYPMLQQSDKQESNNYPMLQQSDKQESNKHTMLRENHKLEGKIYPVSQEDDGQVIDKDPVIYKHHKEKGGENQYNKQENVEHHKADENHKQESVEHNKAHENHKQERVEHHKAHENHKQESDEDTMLWENHRRESVGRHIIREHHKEECDEDPMIQEFYRKVSKEDTVRQETHKRRENRYSVLQEPHGQKMDENLGLSEYHKQGRRREPLAQETNVNYAIRFSEIQADNEHDNRRQPLLHEKSTEGNDHHSRMQEDKYHTGSTSRAIQEIANQKNPIVQGTAVDLMLQTDDFNTATNERKEFPNPMTMVEPGSHTDSIHPMTRGANEQQRKARVACLKTMKHQVIVEQTVHGDMAFPVTCQVQFLPEVGVHRKVQDSRSRSIAREPRPRSLMRDRILIGCNSPRVLGNDFNEPCQIQEIIGCNSPGILGNESNELCRIQEIIGCNSRGIVGNDKSNEPCQIQDIIGCNSPGIVGNDESNEPCQIQDIIGCNSPGILGNDESNEPCQIQEINFQCGTRTKSLYREKQESSFQPMVARQLCRRQTMAQKRSGQQLLLTNTQPLLPVKEGDPTYLKQEKISAHKTPEKKELLLMQRSTIPPTSHPKDADDVIDKSNQQLVQQVRRGESVMHGDFVQQPGQEMKIPSLTKSVDYQTVGQGDTCFTLSEERHDNRSLFENIRSTPSIHKRQMQDRLAHRTIKPPLLQNYTRQVPRIGLERRWAQMSTKPVWKELDKKQRHETLRDNKVTVIKSAVDQAWTHGPTPRLTLRSLGVQNLPVNENTHLAISPSMDNKSETQRYRSPSVHSKIPVVKTARERLFPQGQDATRSLFQNHSNQTIPESGKRELKRMKYRDKEISQAIPYLSDSKTGEHNKTLITENMRVKMSDPIRGDSQTISTKQTFAVVKSPIESWTKLSVNRGRPTASCLCVFSNSAADPTTTNLESKYKFHQRNLSCSEGLRLRRNRLSLYRQRIGFRYRFNPFKIHPLCVKRKYRRDRDNQRHIAMNTQIVAASITMTSHYFRTSRGLMSSKGQGEQSRTPSGSSVTDSLCHEAHRTCRYAKTPKAVISKADDAWLHSDSSMEDVHCKLFMNRNDAVNDTTMKDVASSQQVSFESRLRSGEGMKDLDIAKETPDARTDAKSWRSVLGSIEPHKNPRESGPRRVDENRCHHRKCFEGSGRSDIDFDRQARMCRPSGSVSTCRCGAGSVACSQAVTAGPGMCGVTKWHRYDDVAVSNDGRDWTADQVNICPSNLRIRHDKAQSFHHVKSTKVKDKNLSPQTSLGHHHQFTETPRSGTGRTMDTMPNSRTLSPDFAHSYEHTNGTPNPSQLQHGDQNMEGAQIEKGSANDIFTQFLVSKERPFEIPVDIYQFPFQRSHGNDKEKAGSRTPGRVAISGPLFNLSVPVNHHSNWPKQEDVMPTFCQTERSPEDEETAIETKTQDVNPSKMGHGGHLHRETPQSSPKLASLHDNSMAETAIRSYPSSLQTSCRQGHGCRGLSRWKNKMKKAFHFR